MIISYKIFAFYEWLIDCKGLSAEEFARLVEEEPETLDALEQEFEVCYQNAIRIKINKK